MEWIIIGALAFVIVCIAIMYFINGRKIKKGSGKQDKPESKKVKQEKVTESKPKDGKVEVESKITAETPLETAMKEENQLAIESDRLKAFQVINDSAKQYENKQKLQKGKLKFEREKFKSQIQQSIEENNLYAERKHLKSETATIGKEGPTVKRLDQAKTESENETKSNDLKEEKTIAQQISNLSPEMRALLINDILNNKY